MSILLLMDSAEKLQIETELQTFIPGMLLQTFPTPFDLSRPDKPFCHLQSRIVLFAEYLKNQGHDLSTVDGYINSLETVIYNYPVWFDSKNVIPSNTLLQLAPIGSWNFILEGTSTGGETFLTQATKMAIPSNQTPAILPANLAVVSMTWINEVDGANDDLKIYLNGSLVYTWQVLNGRWGIIVSEDKTPLMILPERGLVSASITNSAPPGARDGILTMYFRLIGETTIGEYISPTL